MVDDELFTIIDDVLRPIGATSDPGEEFRDPPLDVLRFHQRPVRLHWVPWLGRALSLVAVVRQPIDVAFSTEGYSRLIRRVAMAANGRYPPLGGRRGLVIGLTAVVLTPEPIAPGDDALLPTALVGLSRMRSVPLGVIRLNLGQEAMAFALGQGPDNLFPEPAALADELTKHFRRFVPAWEG
jgi:hypothetical protein